MKTFFLTCLIISFLFLFSLPGSANAHAGGGPPFLQVNGTYAQTNPYFQGESTLNIPQDIAPATYIVGKPIHFAVDITKLQVPQDIAERSTFRWSFGSGKNYEHVDKQAIFARSFDKTYDKQGSYLVSLEVKGPGEADYVLIDTVQVNILPKETYKLPQVKVFAGSDSWNSNYPVTFVSQATVDPSATIAVYNWDFADQQIEKGVKVTHIYRDSNLYTYMYHRIIDSNGFITDVGFNISAINNKLKIAPFGNMKSAPIQLGSTSQAESLVKKEEDSKQTAGVNFFVVISGILGIGALSLLYLILRRKN